METTNIAKNRKHFICSICNYNTSNKFDYEKHCKTIKHKNAILETKSDDLETFCDKKTQHIEYTCNCGKIYKNNSGLWKHKKKCSLLNDNNDNDNNTTDKELMMRIIKDNAELKNIIIKVIEKNGCNNINNNTNINTNSHNNTNINSHNKTFNLNFYLNETCKDAINIDDFVKSIKVQLDDLENTGRTGYVNGISDIINNNINSMNAHIRPIHCTDEKREVLYIKNEGQWIKESDTKPILTNAIKTIANKNIQTISEWKKVNPDCTDINSKKNNLYLKIVSNSMSGISKEECEKNYNKIVKNIVKQNIVDKNIVDKE